MHVSTRPPIKATRVTCCMTCKWRHWHELAALDDDDLKVLDDARAHSNYRAGQYLFQAGAPCLGLFAVSSGVIGIRRTDALGNSVLVRLAFAGEMVGYRTFFSGGNYTGEAQALTDCAICFFDARAVREVLQHNASFSNKFLERMARDLDNAEVSFLQQATLPVRARVAYLLLRLKDGCATTDAQGRVVWNLPVSRQDIGAMLGTRPETITRAIMLLQQDGVAVFRGRTVEVANLDRLMAQVEQRT